MSWTTGGQPIASYLFVCKTLCTAMNLYFSTESLILCIGTGWLAMVSPSCNYEFRTQPRLPVSTSMSWTRHGQLKSLQHLQNQSANRPPFLPEALLHLGRSKRQNRATTQMEAFSKIILSWIQKWKWHYSPTSLWGQRPVLLKYSFIQNGLAQHYNQARHMRPGSKITKIDYIVIL